MSPSLSSKLAAGAVLAALAVRTVTAEPQKLAKRYVGVDFETDFNFYDDADPTNGFVNYVSKSTAKQLGLIQSSNNYFKMKVDDFTPIASGRGRSAVRIVSKDEYADGVYVLDVDHMPVGCGTWPAWWTTTLNGWPKGGEIDIIEGSNAWPGEETDAWKATFPSSGPNRTAAFLQTDQDTASLHTIPSCNVEQEGRQTGVQASRGCDANINNNQGCGVELGNATWGSSWNANNGGYYVLHRDFSKSRTIAVYTFPRTASNTPQELSDSASTAVDPSTWGITPQANFTIPQCREDTFNSHVIVFNIALCGDLAANTFVGNGCPGTCNDFVANNPAAMRDAWWGIRNMRVYTASGSPVEEGMRPWVAALISVASIGVALLGTMVLLYYVYRKRRGHNHSQHVELVDSDGLKGAEYSDDPAVALSDNRRPSNYGPFVNVDVHDIGPDSTAPTNRNSQVVGSRRPKPSGSDSNRNSTVGNRKSGVDSNRVSMFSFQAPPNRTSAYSAVGAANANANRNSRVYVDPRANLGPLKVGDGGIVPRAPSEVLPGETPAVSSMKQYNTLGASSPGGSGGGGGRLSKARGPSPSTSQRTSRRGNVGRANEPPSAAAPSPRQSQRGAPRVGQAIGGTGASNRSSYVSDGSGIIPPESAAMDRKSSWDSQVGQKLARQQGRRPSADAETADAQGGGWGTDDEQ